MKTISRPSSLSQVAEWSKSESAFGLNLADFEHELSSVSSRKALLAATEREPDLLASVFLSGKIVDAWLASYAEHLAYLYDLAYPNWIWDASRFLDSPYVHDAHSKRLKLYHTLKSPAAFSRRNLFVDVHLPAITIRRGRPLLSAEHKREMNRKRVRKFRKKRRRILTVNSDDTGALS